MTATATAPTDPACGKCGYCVRGLASFTCPECGSDLREVGIVTGPRAGRYRSVVRVIIWTLALPLPAILVSQMLTGFVLPVVHEQHLQRVIFCQYPQLSTTLTVRQDGRRLAWGGTRRDVTTPLTDMTIEQSRGAANSLHVDLKTGGYRFPDGTGRPVTGPTGFDANVLVRWLAATGFNSADPLVRSGADDILTCINEIPGAQRNFTTFPTPGKKIDIVAHPTWAYSFHSPPTWNTIALLAFWVIVWIAGVWKIQHFKGMCPAHGRTTTYDDCLAERLE